MRECVWGNCRVWWQTTESPSRDALQRGLEYVKLGGLLYGDVTRWRLVRADLAAHLAQWMPAALCGEA